MLVNTRYINSTRGTSLQRYRITVGDSCLCCCACVTYFKHQLTPLYVYIISKNQNIISVKEKMSIIHSCQPILGVNLSPELVNLYFPYAGQGLLFFCWWQQHFEFQPARVAVEGRSNVVRNTHARLQISLPTRFLSLLH